MCGACSVAEDRRRKQNRLAPTIAELRRIADLPSGGVPEMLDVVHQHGRVVEGVTHHFADVRNCDVAEVLQEVFGTRDRWLVPHPEGHVSRMYGREVFLEIDGAKRRIAPSKVEGDSAYTTYHHIKARNDLMADPDDLFNPQLWHEPNFPDNVYMEGRGYEPLEPLLAEVRKGPQYGDFEGQQGMELRRRREARKKIGIAGILATAVGVVVGVLLVKHGSGTAAGVLFFLTAVAAVAAGAAFWPMSEIDSRDAVLPWSPEPL